MNLLYADESGSAPDPSQIFFVLAGISVFERQCFWIDKKLDNIAARFNPGDPTSVELHGSPMFTGKGLWRRFSSDERIQAIKDALMVLTESHMSHMLFIDSRASRLIQLADLVSYAIYRHYEKNDSQFYSIIAHKIDNDGNQLHGLCELI